MTKINVGEGSYSISDGLSFSYSHTLDIRVKEDSVRTHSGNRPI